MPYDSRRETEGGFAESLILAFALPVFVLLLIFAVQGIFPAGDQSFLRIDLYHQYAPFMADFQDKLKSGKSLLYSWDVGMGVNFSALYAYYLASPVNWLLLIWPREYVIEFITIMMLLKTGLCGVTFAWYLQKHCLRTSFGAGFFGAFYALSSYMVAYNWNVMWLDCIWLFPLMIYGLERLYREGKPFLYCITLGLSILSNYYISIMVCMSLVLYFIAYMAMEPAGRRQILSGCARFAVYSLLAGMLAGCVLIPEVLALRATASGNFSFPKTWEMYFPIMDMLARHMGGVKVETGLDHWPNIYCGTAVYLLFLLYIRKKEIPVRERAGYVTLLILYLASFSINVLNFIWHGFHYPNSLPARQSFVYMFLLLTACFRAYLLLDDTTEKEIGGALGASMVFVLLAQKTVTDDAFHFAVFYGAMLFLALYAGLMLLNRNPYIRRGTVRTLAVALVGVEMVLNTAVTISATTSRTAYTEDDSAIRLLTATLEPEEVFYRVEKMRYRTKNDGAWLQFPTCSLFSSLTNARVTAFYKSFGNEGSTNAYSTNGMTPLGDTLFSVRYVLSKRETQNPEMHLVQSIDDWNLYENPFVLPLGFVLPDGMETRWKYDASNPAEVQNTFAELAGAQSVMDLVPSEEEGDTLYFTPDRSGAYYIQVGNRTVDTVRLETPDHTDTFDNVDRGYFVEAGYLMAGDSIQLTSTKPKKEALRASVYRFDYDALGTVYDNLSREALKVRTWEDDRITGSITLAEPGLVFLSIPYDRGWSVTVDGKKTETEELFGAFTGIRLESGIHEISMTFMPEGMYAGIAITGAALLALALAAVLEGLLVKRRAAAASVPAEDNEEELSDQEEEETT